MVIYDLVCGNGHTFEGWFDNMADFEQQKADALLACPMCNTLSVSRTVTAPNVASKANAVTVSSKDNSKLDTPMMAAEGSPETFAKVQDMLKKVHEYVDQNYQDVGNRFAEEALSMHKGEKEQAPIRGTANAKQVKELAEEGVSALALPERPIDKKKIN